MPVSKNEEITGQRVRAYDEWRRTVDLPFASLPYVECSRIPWGELSQDGEYTWPPLRLVSVVVPQVLEPGVAPTFARALCLAASPSAHQVRQVLAAAALPLYGVVIDSAFQYFWPVDLWEPEKSTAPLVAADATRRLMRQVYQPHQAPPRPEHVSPYSHWHRHNLPANALLVDIDYVEMRAGEPVAFLEVSQANHLSLRRSLFDVLTRAFVQLAGYRQLGETLGVPAYCVAYYQDMQQLFVMEITREVVHFAQRMSPLRNALAQEQRELGMASSQAHGIACTKLWDEHEQAFFSLLDHCFWKEMDERAFVDWLVELSI